MYHAECGVCTLPTMLVLFKHPPRSIPTQQGLVLTLRHLPVSLTAAAHRMFCSFSRMQSHSWQQRLMPPWVTLGRQWRQQQRWWSRCSSARQTRWPACKQQRRPDKNMRRMSIRKVHADSNLCHHTQQFCHLCYTHIDQRVCPLCHT